MTRMVVLVISMKYEGDMETCLSTESHARDV